MQAENLLCPQDVLSDPERSGQRKEQVANASVGAAAARIPWVADPVPAALLPLATLVMGIPAIPWLGARGACAQARAEEWQLRSHIQPLPDMAGNFRASALEIFLPPGQPVPVPQRRRRSWRKPRQSAHSSSGPQRPP